MKTGIIGFPQVGKTALFTMLTGVEAAAGRRDDRLGVARIPDSRLDQLAELFHPRKLTHATLELIEVGGLTPESLRDGTGIAGLRTVDALIHVVRAFNDPAVPHSTGTVNPARDATQLEFDMIISDLGQVEKRLERVEKDLKKQRSKELVEEAELLRQMKAHLETEKPLRAMRLAGDAEKRMRGFQFLSQKPILYALNVDEAEAASLDDTLARHGFADIARQPGAGVVAICAKVEAEIAALAPEDAREFLAGYGLQESGLTRLARAAYALLGQISFFTVGEDECRAWTIPAGTRAVDGAGVIHTDLAKHYIRAEVVRWDDLLRLGSEAAAREQALLRLEGKDYIIRDGDVLHIRHSG
jgi:GTP-binding protein YchF